MNDSTIIGIPEICSLSAGRNLIRIPDETDVPVTDRVKRLIDTAPFRRLSRISQLGLVSLIYPGANHTRFEHSLGVYRTALLYLKQLANDSRFVSTVTSHDAEVLIVAALLHDIGHWPFCHPIEDMRLDGIPKHEAFAESFLRGNVNGGSNEIEELLSNDWNINVDEVLAFLKKQHATPGAKILNSVMSGPVDIDKMDYLYRDSLHAGVPYGKNFDQQRLTGSLCLNKAGDGIAISEKGKTAAEMMVFARYVMFSEVYWHHAVRSATAMLQRGFYLIRDAADWQTLFRSTEDDMTGSLREIAKGTDAEVLIDGLFGARRSLYKRLAQFSYMENRELYDRIARQPFAWLVERSERFADLLSAELGAKVASHEILFDAPPVKLEVEFNVEVYSAKRDSYQQLSDVSPVVESLARKQFDDYVKRVRIFVHPRLMDDKIKSLDIASLLLKIVD